MKRWVGLGVYYVLFGLLAFGGITRHWPLMIPMIVVVLVVGYIAVDGPPDRVADYKTAVRDPMVADEVSPGTSGDSPRRLTLLLIALPPLAYVIGDLFFF